MCEAVHVARLAGKDLNAKSITNVYMKYKLAVFTKKILCNAGAILKIKISR